MGEIKDYVWAFPLVGGVLGLISLLTPTAYFSYPGSTMNIWMWGLFSVQIGYQSITRFTADLAELSLSLTCSAIVLISLIALISSGTSHKKKMRMGVMKKAAWLTPSILLIIGTLMWMVGLELISIYGVGFSFWSNMNPGFGVIGMFISAALSIIGYGVSKMKAPRREEIIIPMKKGFMAPEREIGAPGSEITKSTLTSFKFCPNCGQKIISQEHRFCTNCGFELRGIPMTPLP